ncbi:MAG: ActD-like protein [Myxococcaceae bacterium]|nr:ActD-like protein [Myxococcaceae bacterium]
MNSPRRTPGWLLERIALGELPPTELAAARARLALEPDGPARLAALEADNHALLEKPPPATVAREVLARAAQGREAAKERPWGRFAPAFALVPMLAATALFAVTRPGAGAADTGAEVPEVTRTKGLMPQLVVHRQGAAGPERLADGAAAAAGDVVQVSYVAAGRRHGVILSVDGRGVVTVHAPDVSASAPIALAGSGTHALPRAYALDDAPAFERFLFITSDTPFALDEVLAAAREAAVSGDARTTPLALPEGYTQVSFTLEKVSP